MNRKRSRLLGAALTVATAFAALLVVCVPAAPAAGDANKAECSTKTEASPGFRTYLPDCRAYELVSPAYTQGFAINGGFGTSEFPVSRSGLAVSGVSLGSFAGQEYDNIVGFRLGSQYLFSRGSSGWETEGLTPSASLAALPEEWDLDAELQNSLWVSTDNASFGPPTAPPQLYLRQADGHFAVFGPLSPIPGSEFVYRGSSSDFSRVAFRLLREPEGSDPLWPGDTTIAGKSGDPQASLYEYSGVSGSEPRMVGVRNEGVISSNTEAQPITECGTELGSGRDSYNAVSPSGFAVFFTAQPGGCTSAGGVEVGTGPELAEVYARVEGARTVAISEPSLSVPGRECTGVCAETERKENGHLPSEGTFAGASEDGHRVLLLTTQPLVNTDTDATTDLYMAELNATGMTRLVDVSGGGAGDPTPGSGASVSGVVRISEDGGRVYFVAKGVLTNEPNVHGEVAETGKNNLYLYDVASGNTMFVARLASTGDTSVWSAEDVRNAQVSAGDGRFLVFLSKAHLASTGDTSGTGTNVAQLFEFDAQTGSLTRVSIGQKGSYLCPTTSIVEEGYNCNGNVQVAGQAPAIKKQGYLTFDFATRPYMEVNVTSGGTVFFESIAALTPGAVNGLPNASPGFKNVYEYEDGEIYLISDGAEVSVGTSSGGIPQAKTLFVSATNDGGALFVTADALVPQDTNTQVSLYDAHVDGGFPAPTSPAQCLGEGCRGLPSSVGEVFSPASIMVQQGNVVASRALAHKHKRVKPKRRHRRGKQSARRRSGLGGTATGRARAGG